MKNIIFFVSVLLLTSVAMGAQSIYIDYTLQPAIVLEIGQSCTFTVVSDDSASYHDYLLVMTPAASMGDFTLLSIDPTAGSDATAVPYTEAGMDYAYDLYAGGSSPPPSSGPHFTFLFEAQQEGSTLLFFMNEFYIPIGDPVALEVVKPEPEPLGTAFTYQGHLYDANEIANGQYDFQFKLFDFADTNPNVSAQQGSTVDIDELDVVDGYFTAELNFGSDVFDGDKRWLQIAVRPGQDPGEYTVLTPRQEITPVPYALQTRGMFVNDDGNVTIGSSAVVTQKLNVVGHTYISGSLGLGASTPVQKLDVRGNVHISNNVGIGTPTPAYDLDVVGTANVDEIRLGGVSRTSWPVGGDSSWTVSGSDMYSSVSGDVGIGTSSPEEKLHVYESGSSVYVKAESDSGVSFFVADGSTNSGIIMREGGANKASMYWHGSGDYLRIGEYADPKLAFKDGKVGIGTVAPVKELHVAGDIRLDAYKSISFGSDITRVVESMGDLWMQASDDLYLQPNDDIRMDIDTLFVDGSHDRVGIGTTTPTAKLNIAGPNTVDALHVVVDGSPRLVVENDGDVGIGIYNPTEELHVIGDTYISGSLGVGATPTPVYRLNVSGAVRADTLVANDDVIVYDMDSTSGDGYEVRIYSNKLYKNTSSARYKDDIQPLADDFYKILSAEPKSFINKASGNRGIGFIAEEFDQIGLSNLVIYKDGQPDALKYDLVSLYLLEVLKEQVEITKQLNEEIKSLKTQLKTENHSLLQRLEALEKTMQQPKAITTKGALQ